MGVEIYLLHFWWLENKKGRAGILGKWDFKMSDAPQLGFGARAGLAAAGEAAEGSAELRLSRSRSPGTGSYSLLNKFIGLI